MKDYVHTYLKENQEAILHGDSAGFHADDLSVTRLDAVPGRHFKTMINSISGWLGQYVPEDNEGKSGSPIYMGLGNIADSTFDFNEGQFEKSAKTVLGVEFPVGEDWWPDAKEYWRNENYKYIWKTLNDYKDKVSALTEQAVTSGWSVKTLSERIHALDTQMTTGKANFIARDQIGKLNGEITQRRDESTGLTMYIWETSGDERVRPSHEMMDGGLCRWDNSMVYSDDGGKTWIPRPSGAVLLHPGMDYQCRCTAAAYWQELVDEVDEKIAEIEGLDTLAAQNIADMPKSATSDPSISLLKAQTNQKIQEQRKREKNMKACAETAKKNFPNETWLPADDVKLKYEKTPKKLDNIRVAKSKMPMNKNGEETFVKELKQAIVLSLIGAAVYLLPKLKNSRGNDIPGPDAIVNGQYMEFKTITGSLGKVERRFRESRNQGENVFLKIDNKKLSKHDIINKIRNILTDPKYTGGTKGNLILYIIQTNKTYFIRIRDLK
jgi:SPP1 gp7 family putative phage head morphogenesis protein